MTDRVLVLGGTGFIGRHMVKYLVDNDACAAIRVADKVPPSMAYMNEEFAKAFQSPLVEFVQSNLSNAASIEKAFTSPNGDFNIVINCAAETRYGQDDKVYEQSVRDLSVKCAEAAAKHGAKKFIELSTGQIYSAGKKASDEKAKTSPWTSIAQYKLEAEEKIKATKGLNYIILRPSIVYGVGDVRGLTPRIICALVYKKLKENMKFLWGADLRINTVHVSDVVRAIWHCAQNVAAPAIYNLCDEADTSQGTFNDILAKIFNIETSFYGTIASQAAKAMMKDTVETVNEKHMEPWAEITKEQGISNTPLTPYLDQELLYNNSLSIDGSAITKTGFSYEVKTPTEENIKEVIKKYQELKLFPTVEGI